MGTTPKYVSIDETAVNVFTDGSSYSGPRRGGAAFLIITVDEAGDEVVEEHLVHGREAGTNQEMEMLAVIEALELLGGRHSPIAVREYSKVLVFTDSQYVKSNYQLALYQWPGTKWHTRDGNPVAHARLWKRLTKASLGLPVTVRIEWAKGHSKFNPHNKQVDKLAKQSAKGHLLGPLSPRQVRRKKSTGSTEVGSICPEGQRLTIHVIHEQWFPEQRICRYKIEVVSESSPYLGKVDNYFSTLLLKRGHVYDVQLGDDPKRPRIEKLFGEVDAPE